MTRASGLQLDLHFPSPSECTAFLEIYKEFEAAFDKADDRGGKESLHVIRSYTFRLLEAVGDHARRADLAKALKTQDPARVFEILELIYRQMCAEKTNSQGGV